MNVIAEVTHPENTPHCLSCGVEVAVEARFCPSCGVPRTVQADTGNWSDTVQFFWACGLIVVYILSSYVVEEWSDYRYLLAFDVGFFLLVCAVALRYARSLGTALKPRGTTIRNIALYGTIQLLLTTLVLLLVPRINAVFDQEEVSYVWPYFLSPHPLLFAVLSVAVMPAITEELAFRGILFGQLSKLTGTASAIIVTGILFAFVHFSLLSLFWLLPAGLFYGWIRSREGHIWWGVVLHLLHNAVVVMEEFSLF